MQTEATYREPKPISQLRAMEKKAIILDALSAQGFNDHQAAKLMNIAPSYPAALKEKREKGLLAPLAKIARKSVKQLALGELVGNMKEIKGSDILGACNTILDRADPKVNKQEIKSLHASIEITAEDRERLITNLGLLQAPQQVVIEGQYEQVTKIVTDK